MDKKKHKFDIFKPTHRKIKNKKLAQCMLCDQVAQYAVTRWGLTNYVCEAHKHSLDEYQGF